MSRERVGREMKVMDPGGKKYGVEVGISVSLEVHNMVLCTVARTISLDIAYIQV